MAQRTLVVRNPMSRGAAGARRWRALEAKLRDALGPLEVETTRAPHDAARLAREGVRAGVERLIVAGGDGTLSEVVTGLLAAKLSDYVTLGLIPLGTGSDFARSVDVPREVEAAITVIAEGRSRAVDAGRATYRGADGRELVSYFANAASFGISALVTEIVNRTTKVLGGTATFAIGAVRAILQYRPVPVTIRVDGEIVFEGPLVLGACANGFAFGGGMRVAPEARVDDGLLDVVVVSRLSAPRLLVKLPMIYRGAHLSDPAVDCHRGRVVEAEVAERATGLELDGEPLGVLPARFEVLPGVLSVLGPAPASGPASDG